MHTAILCVGLKNCQHKDVLVVLVRVSQSSDKVALHVQRISEDTFFDRSLEFWLWLSRQPQRTASVASTSAAAVAVAPRTGTRAPFASSSYGPRAPDRLREGGAFPLPHQSGRRRSPPSRPPRRAAHPTDAPVAPTSKGGRRPVADSQGRAAAPVAAETAEAAAAEAAAATAVRGAKPGCRRPVVVFPPSTSTPPPLIPSCSTQKPPPLPPPHAVSHRYPQATGIWGR